jgi:hypothetical protein
MTDSLRAKQNMEILDVWKNLNSQIVGRENKQIQAFPESLLPKTQRDLGAEVNTDKSVENINRVLETKLGSLEYLVQQFASGQGVVGLTKTDVRTTAHQAEEQITNTGDVVPLWNSIVRLYQQQGLSRESQNVLKVKVQELSPNLDAITYGMNQAVDWVFRERNMNSSLGLMVLEFLRTLSVYTVIKSQVESGQFELLSMEQLQRQYKNTLEEQPSDRLAILKEYAPRGAITNTSIRNIPDFDILSRRQRLRDIANELGINPRQLTGNQIGAMTGSEFNKYIEDIRKTSRSEKAGFDMKANHLIQELEDKVSLIRALGVENDEANARILAFRELIQELQDKDPIDEDEVRRLTREVPEEEVVPDEPRREDFEDDEAFARDMEDYDTVLNRIAFSRAERAMILEYNQGLIDQMTKNKADRLQLIREKQRRILSNEGSIAKRQAKGMAIVRSFSDYERRVKELHEGKSLTNTIQTLYNAIARRVKGMKPENEAIIAQALQRESGRRDAPPLAPRVVPVRRFIEEDPDEKEAVGEGRHKGRPIDTRGRASLRKNYGFESMSDSDSDSSSESDNDRPFDFDDSRNDMYYTKPMRK